MKQTQIIIMLTALLLASTSAFADDGIGFSGKIESTAFRELGSGKKNNGFSQALTLIMETETEDAVNFRAEGGFTLDFGAASTEAKIFESGLAPAPDANALPPGYDLHNGFFLNQAFASVNLDRLAVRAGIIPISWGSAYLYNPTGRTGEPSFPGEALDTERGKAGAHASWAIPLTLPISLSAEGYALAQSRLSGTVPSLDEIEDETIPFGLRISGMSNIIDLSISFMRERMVPQEDGDYYAGADIVVNAGDVNCYAEAAINLGTKERDLSIGFAYDIPILEITLRSEFFSLGNGDDKASDYKTADFLAGKKSLLGKEYVFAGLEKEDAEAGRWNVSMGAIVNLNDHSAAALAEFNLVPVPLFETGVFIRYCGMLNGKPTGEAEFGGERVVAPSISITPYESIVGISAKWSF